MDKTRPSLDLDKPSELGFVNFFAALPPKADATLRLFERGLNGDYFSAHGDDALFVANDVYKTSQVVRDLGGALNGVVQSFHGRRIHIRNLKPARAFRLSRCQRSTQSPSCVTFSFIASSESRFTPCQTRKRQTRGNARDAPRLEICRPSRTCSSPTSISTSPLLSLPSKCLPKTIRRSLGLPLPTQRRCAASASLSLSIMMCLATWRCALIVAVVYSPGINSPPLGTLDPYYPALGQGVSRSR